jgi:hypothetical protein
VPETGPRQNPWGFGKHHATEDTVPLLRAFLSRVMRDATVAVAVPTDDAGATCHLSNGRPHRQGTIGVLPAGPSGASSEQPLHAEPPAVFPATANPADPDQAHAPHQNIRDQTCPEDPTSYRLKMIRAGLQDRALFELADELGLGDYAREQVAQVYGQFHGCDWDGCAPPISSFYWTTDASLMDDIRRNIAEVIITDLSGE